MVKTGLPLLQLICSGGFVESCHWPEFRFGRGEA